MPRFSGVPGNALPEALEIVAWTIDPMLCASFGTQANVHAFAVTLPAGRDICTLSVPVNSAGSSMTAAQLGIYDASLNLLASTPNVAASFNGTTGWIENALSSPWEPPVTDCYYLASAFAGGVLPSVGFFLGNSVTSGKLPNGNYRGIHGQAQGTLPATIISSGGFSQQNCIVAR